MIDTRMVKEMRRILQKQFMPETVNLYSITVTRNIAAQETTSRTFVTTISGQFAEVSRQEREIISALTKTGIENTESIKLIIPFDTVIDTSQQIETVSGIFWNVIPLRNKTYTAGMEVLLTRQITTSGVMVNG